MTDPLHQINVSYAAKEDRLLLRVSTRGGDEYRVWLTRRFTRLLLGLLRKQMEKYGGAPTIAASGETRRMFRQGAMNQSYDAERSEGYPLGQQGVLAVRVNATAGQDGRLGLQLLPEGDQGVTLNLDKTLLYLFYNLLTQGIEQAQWNLQSAEDQSGRVH
jgi:hypothetical protein